MNNLSDVIFSMKESGITSVATIFEKLKENNIFIDLNDSENSVGNIFHNFIESVGYDGIIMDANIFTNVMKEVKNTKHYITRNSYNIKLADGTNEKFSLLNPDIRFRMIQKKPDNKIDLTVAINEIEKFHNQFPNLPITRIFKKNEDAITYTKTNDDSCGFFYDNHSNKFVGLILENIKDKEELVKTLLHEHLGHASLKELLGRDFKNTMLSLYNYFEKNNVIKRQENITIQEKLLIAEEQFAITMETNSIHKITVIEKVATKIMSAIRKVFNNTPMIEAEIKNLVVNIIENAQIKKPNQETIVKKNKF